MQPPEVWVAGFTYVAAGGKGGVLVTRTLEESTS
jgi:hypothetical protein